MSPMLTIYGKYSSPSPMGSSSVMLSALTTNFPSVNNRKYWEATLGRFSCSELPDVVFDGCCTPVYRTWYHSVSVYAYYGEGTDCKY